MHRYAHILGYEHTKLTAIALLKPTSIVVEGTGDPKRSLKLGAQD